MNNERLNELIKTYITRHELIEFLKKQIAFKEEKNNGNSEYCLEMKRNLLELQDNRCSNNDGMGLCSSSRMIYSEYCGRCEAERTEIADERLRGFLLRVKGEKHE